MANPPSDNRDRHDEGQVRNRPDGMGRDHLSSGDLLLAEALVGDVDGAFDHGRDEAVLVLEQDEVGAVEFGCLGEGGPDGGHLFFGQDEVGVEGGQARLLRPEDTGWDVPGETRHDFLFVP